MTICCAKCVVFLYQRNNDAVDVQQNRTLQLHVRVNNAMRLKHYFDTSNMFMLIYLDQKI